MSIKTYFTTLEKLVIVDVICSEVQSTAELPLHFCSKIVRNVPNILESTGVKIDLLTIVHLQ